MNGSSPHRTSGPDKERYVMWSQCALLLVAAVSAARSHSLAPSRATTPPEADTVVEFWRSAGPKAWFAKDPEFDRRFRDRFLALHEAAALGELDSWLTTARGALALCLL